MCQLTNPSASTSKCKCSISHLHLSSGLLLVTISHKRGQLFLGPSLLLWWGQSCHVVACPPPLAPSRHEAAEVQVLSSCLKLHVFLDSIGSQGDQGIVASLETRMENGRWHCQTLLSLQGLFGHLVMWGCGPQSGDWLQLSGHLNH